MLIAAAAVAALVLKSRHDKKLEVQDEERVRQAKARADEIIHNATQWADREYGLARIDTGEQNNFLTTFKDYVMAKQLDPNASEETVKSSLRQFGGNAQGNPYLIALAAYLYYGKEPIAGEINQFKATFKEYLGLL